MAGYFSCIFCRENSTGGIGFQNHLPWGMSIKEDMELFKTITKGTDKTKNVLIMGKNTYKSLGGKELPGRSSIDIGTPEYPSLDSALKWISSEKSLKDSKIFVIGGKRLFTEAFAHPLLETIYESTLFPLTPCECDVFFPNSIPDEFSCVDVKTFTNPYYYLVFKQYNRMGTTSENQYLSLLERVLHHGNPRDDRTGTGTISMFGTQMEFDLQEGFPLLTTKKVFFRGVIEELLWMLRGETNNNILKQKGIHIWDGNAGKEYLTKLGLGHFPEGELGRIYGMQWRHFGGNFVAGGKHTGGFDQIADVIHQIKTNPTSRRIIVSGWNPLDLKEMALPCCHLMHQYYVENDVLHLKVDLRSNDLFLGAPFNIASYALLLTMIAHICHLKPGKLIYSVGDAHIYKNHIKQVEEQLLRPCRHLPTLTLHVPNTVQMPEDFTYEMFELQSYTPHPTISGEMAV